MTIPVNYLSKSGLKVDVDFADISRINTLAFDRPDEAGLIEKLRHDAAFIPALSLLAEADGTPAGHILFTRITIQNGSEQHPSLAHWHPWQFLPEFQGKGIGSALVRHGLDKATELGFQSVIVLGHENYYPRFGFISGKQVPDKGALSGTGCSIHGTGTTGRRAKGQDWYGYISVGI